LPGLLCLRRAWRLRPLRSLRTRERHPIDRIILKKTIDTRPRIEIQQGFKVSRVVRDLLQVTASGAEFNHPGYFYKHAAAALRQSGRFSKACAHFQNCHKH
jgi:hypothetical protein